MVAAVMLSSRRLLRAPRCVSAALSTTPQPPAPAADNNRRVDTKLTAQDIAGAALPTSALLRPRENTQWQVVKPEHLALVPAPKDWDAQLEKLQQRIGVQFRDVTHLKCALTHSGAFPLNALPADVPAHRLANRSLEFLGDSLLGFAVASHVFQAQAAHQEGQLTLAKSALVNNDTLARICEDHLEMHELILVAPDYSHKRRSLKTSYQRGRATIQAGAVESLIAAIYLDQGLETALSFVNTHVLPHAVAIAKGETIWQPIPELQRLLQARGVGQPIYKHLPKPLTSEEFKVALVVNGQTVAIGTGTSYKAARVAAAESGYVHYSHLLEAST